MSMAQLKVKIYNNTTGKVMFNGVKCTGLWDELYDKFVLWFNKLVRNNWRKSEGIYIYGDCYYGVKKSYYSAHKFPRLFKPHMRKSNAYVWFIDGAYVYEYRLIR